MLSSAAVNGIGLRRDREYAAAEERVRAADATAAAIMSEREHIMAQRTGASTRRLRESRTRLMGKKEQQQEEERHQHQHQRHQVQQEGLLHGDTETSGSTRRLANSSASWFSLDTFDWLAEETRFYFGSTRHASADLDRSRQQEMKASGDVIVRGEADDDGYTR
jgi:hypothetical protein